MLYENEREIDVPQFGVGDISRGGLRKYKFKEASYISDIYMIIYIITVREKKYRNLGMLGKIMWLAETIYP